jgi:hypothetical protein
VPGNFDDETEAVISSGGANLGCEVLANVLWVEQDAAVGVEKGASEVIVLGAKAQKIKGTTTFAIDFDESDDEVHDEEAEHNRVSCLSESTINVITGERVSFQLEKGVSTGDFFTSRIFVLFIFFLKFLLFVFAEIFFPDSSSQREATIDIGKMKEVTQEPATLAEVLEIVPDGVDLETYKHCMEYC